MGLTTYNLNEKWWAISLTYIYIYIYTYPKEKCRHNHGLELVILWLNSRMKSVYTKLKCNNSSRKYPF